MKKLLTGVTLLAISIASFAQQLPPEKQTIREDLLRKSKNQKTTGWIMLGGGAVAAAAGSMIFLANFNFWNTTPQEANWMGSGAILATAGGLSMVGSIFFFVASGNNKKKAMNLTMGLKMEQTNPDLKKVMPPSSYPAMTIKFHFR